MACMNKINDGSNLTGNIKDLCLLPLDYPTVNKPGTHKNLQIPLHITGQEGHTFIVSAGTTEACHQLGFVGKYKLRIGTETVQLLHHDLDYEVTRWPLHGIRKFGFSSLAFFLHAGTRCDTGEGHFIFSTLEGNEISQCLSHQIDQIIGQKKNKNDKKGKEMERQINKDQVKGHQSQSKGNKQLKNNEFKHKVHSEMDKEMQWVPSQSSNPGLHPIFHNTKEREGDYYNCDLYSHLNSNGHPIQENPYGMSSASNAYTFSEKKDANSPDYEYVN